MKPNMKQPYDVIKLDKYTHKIETPRILLMNRSFQVIGKISRYSEWKTAIYGNNLDQIFFTVHKYANGRMCPLWDDLIDLKIVDVDGFGRFEISVNYTDGTETVKCVNGVSLETELAQITLNEFHVNDEDAMDEFSKDNYDADGNFIPTTFYREILDSDTPEQADFKRRHSLLHRVLADKAPHWGIGYVTKFIAMDESSKPEKSSEFQRSYTVDGETVYDFLTGDVSKESNVVFTFDTENRLINCYSLCDCIDQDTGETLEGSVGEDTFICVSKAKLANEITVSSNKDSVKNCLRVEGGDSVITDAVRAVNMNGSNYIHAFAKFQRDDMSEGLRRKIQDYQSMMDAQETKDAYYGEDGIYTRLCKAYDDLSHCESSMSPSAPGLTEPGKAEAQYNKIVRELEREGSYVAVSSMNKYNDSLFAGVTNNIEAYAQIFLDPRFELKIIRYAASFSHSEGDAYRTWTGRMQVSQRSDDKNRYPLDPSSANPVTVKVNDDALAFAKQKVEKALSKCSMLDIDFAVAEMGDEEMRGYFNKHSLHRLKSFADGYGSCLSILIELGQGASETEGVSTVNAGVYEKYKRILDIVNEAYQKRLEEAETIKGRIEKLKGEQRAFIYGGEYEGKAYAPHDFKTYIGDGGLYSEFCKYRREDSYKNSNYISDGLTDAECLKKAKELVEAAEREAGKACALQRTVSVSLNNLFALPEFEPLYESFALFNYIRVRTDDEVLKLRIMSVEFNGDSAEQIEVTFSEGIESIDGTMDDLRSVIKQAGSMATSYPSTVLQAKQGTEAKEAISDIYENGLNASNVALSNNDDNEITVGRFGILCRRMDDEGFYGKKQVRITGSVIAFTDTAWETVKAALGESVFEDPITGEKKERYGLIAENIVGKMIAGDNMCIGNKNNNVLITGDGIIIKNGLIQSANYKEGASGSMIDLTNGAFDYAGGNLTYKDKKLFVKGEVTANKLTATNSGKIANFNISKDELYTDGAEFDNITGSYFGNNGLRIGKSFKVNNKGSLSALSGLIGGWNISDGEISCVDDHKYGITLNSSDKSIMSKSNDNEVILKSDYLGFRKNSVQYVTLHTTFWEDNPTVFGVGINSEPESKFISFGNKKLTSDKSYITPLVLNYGLNPDGDKQDVLIYGSALITGETTLKNKLLFGNGSSYLWHTNTNSIFCSGKFGVNGVSHDSYDFSVNGTGYNSGNFRIGGNLDIDGELIARGSYANESSSGTPNLRIGSECHIRKTAGSSLRFKEMIKPICSEELNPDKLYDIEIVQYQFKQDYLSKYDQRYGKEVIGFIAEDIYSKYPIAADYSVDDNGNTIVEDWNFRYMVPAMLKLIQKQKDDIDALKRKLDKIIAGNVV